MSADGDVSGRGAFEYSIHECPARHAREIEAVFPGVSTEGLLVVPTFQRSVLDLIGLGGAVEAEKDRLLERFIDFAKMVCDNLLQQDYWADYIDPCSGLPMVHKLGNSCYSEVDAASTILGYQTTNAGCCKVLLHPKWRTFVYPATLLAKCPQSALKDALKQAEASLS